MQCPAHISARSRFCWNAQRKWEAISQQCDKTTKPSSWERGQLQNYTCVDKPMQKSRKTTQKW